MPYATCTPPYYGDCENTYYDYQYTVEVDEDCPSPLPNSSYVCTCATAIIRVCYYRCNPGYEWNGSACVLVAVVKKPLMDGFAFID